MKSIDVEKKHLWRHFAGDESSLVFRAYSAVVWLRTGCRLVTMTRPCQSSLSPRSLKLTIASAGCNVDHTYQAPIAVL